MLHTQEVRGSSPIAPTIFITSAASGPLTLLCRHFLSGREADETFVIDSSTCAGCSFSIWYLRAGWQIQDSCLIAVWQLERFGKPFSSPPSSGAIPILTTYGKR